MTGRSKKQQALYRDALRWLREGTEPVFEMRPGVLC
jgi:hypothetical protein